MYLEKIWAHLPLTYIHFKEDSFIQKIQDGYPQSIFSNKALKLGLKANATIDEIIEEFIEDDLENQKKFNALHG